MHRDTRTGPHRYGTVSLQTSMYVVMGITGNIGGVTAPHLMITAK